MALAEIPPASARPRREGRVPPHNLEAEESLLGAMLLSREAIAACSDVRLTAGDFYRPAHGHLFDAITSLYGAGEPVDPVTVADELRRADLLDAVGGPAALIGIQSRTPATSSAAHYARIVGEHALLRRLISVAGEIAEIGYSLPDDVIQAVDRAEAMVFDVAQQRETDSTKQIKDLLDDSLNRLEELYARGESITGLATGYNGLDEMLSGLQPSTLNIVGARPAIGKCLTADTPMVDPATGARTTLGELVARAGDGGDDDIEVVTLDDEHQLTLRRPSQVIDDGIKPVFRVRTRLGREVRTTAAHPFLTPTGWRPLADLTIGTRIAVPRELPVFGDEPVSAEHLERLMARVHAARVDRGVPDAAFRLPQDQLAALLRAVLSLSATTDDGARPEVAYSTPSGAVAKDLQHLLLRFGVNARRRHRPHRGWQLTIRDPEELRSFAKRIGLAGRDDELHRVVRAAAKVIHQHVLDTEAHDSWDEVGAARRHVQRSTVTAQPRPRRATTGRLVAVYDDTRLAISTPSAILWDEVVGIEPDGMEQVYDLTVPGEHNFVAADVFVHNTAFALGMAMHAALEERRPVLFFSLEMGHLELTSRLLSSEARVDSSKLRTGQLSDAEWNKISHAIGRLAEAPLYIDDNPNATVMEIRSKARRLKSKLGDLGLVVIDYLQLMTGRNSAENRQVEVSEISRGLKILARELETPVVALSQLSRQLELRADKRPMLADLRESGSLEQDADVVMFLYRDEVYNADSPDRGTAEVIVSKHRAGPTGVDRLTFINNYTRFANMAKGM